MISVTFPDGAQRQFAPGVSGFEIAKSISPSLAKRTATMAGDYQQRAAKIAVAEVAPALDRQPLARPTYTHTHPQSPPQYLMHAPHTPSCTPSPRLPWCDIALLPETGTISDALVRLNRNGFLTINSQPRANGVSSSDPT